MSREDKGVRELIPHIGPIPILIPLKLFLEGIEFTRIMLPRALRGSYVKAESINMAGIVECEMRIALFILFQFLYGSIGNRGSKAEQRKFSFISGDDLEREENVEIHKTNL